MKSAKFNIDLNAKDEDGRTAFHHAFGNGHSDVVEIILMKSTEINIDLNGKDECGRTGFHHACQNGNSIKGV